MNRTEHQNKPTLLRPINFTTKEPRIDKEKEDTFNKWCWETDNHTEKNETDCYLTPHKKLTHTGLKTCT